MASDGQIVFEVTADGKRAIADIKDITKAIQQETGKWDKAAADSANNMGSNFDGLLKRLAAGFSMAKVGKALLDLGKDAIECASDLQEVQNVVDVTFGSSANTIETWAKNAGKQFGLTEIQAKKFTSTIGAMMKSSGMAGDEIVQMSTDLAGLAADMASFYNLDFEEAFSKIRSGISGQTMPLKELGIDMSVATLNAFALQQGLKKTFNEMSQAEQTMLRYQYLMSATADAQGDFARTSDGYANGMRALETQITTLKTNLGDTLLPAVQWVVGELNKAFGGEEEQGWAKRRTVLDDIADIDVKTMAAVESINATKKVVDELTTSLEEIGSKKGTLEEASGNVTTAVGEVSKLASELGKVKIEGNAKEAFESTLSILYNNVTELSKIKGTDAQGVKDWLDGVATEASKLDPEDATAWATLMTALLTEVPGLSGTEEGKTLVEQLVQYYLSLGSESAEAAKGLASLGFSTDEIDEKQKDWLATCKELVRTMPGLADIIDTNTGEVKGGIPAIKAYADEWERTAKYQAQIENIRQKKALYDGMPEQSEFASNVRTTKATARAYLIGYGKLTPEQADAVLAGAERMANFAYGEELAGNDKHKIDDYGYVTYDKLTDNPSDAYTFFYNGEMWNGTNNGALALPEGSKIEKADKALSDYMKSLYEYEEYKEVQPQMEAAYNEALQETAEAFGITTEAVEKEADAANEAANKMTAMQRAAMGDEDAMSQLETATTRANEALKAMADHAAEVRKNVEDAINGVVKGFDKVDYHTYKSVSENIDGIRKSMEGLKEGSDAWNTQHKELEKYNNQLITTGTIYKNLLSQKQFLDDYLANLEAAQRMGLDAGLLAELSDGSVESAMYLDALVNDKTGGKTVTDINELYQQIQQGKAALSGKLTDNQLTVDQVYQGLVDEAKKAVDELQTLGVPAADNARAMVDAVAAGVSEEQGKVKTAVDGIISELERLSSLSYSPKITLGLGGLFSFFIPQHETGLDRVPFDGYLASLHEGEGILTAEENRVWQRFKNGQGNNAFDYDTMGGVMRDNIKAGGNVYLDGRVVGSVISDQQGKTYRQLQRSGWQG